MRARCYFEFKCFIVLFMSLGLAFGNHRFQNFEGFLYFNYTRMIFVL